MKTILTIAAAAAAFAATPALANEARIEARGGAIWDQGETEATAGVAAGYDVDIAGPLFVGAEVSADKILTEGTRVSFGFGGRIGAKIGERGKLFVASSYQTKPCDGCENSISVGGGYQHAFGERFYGKLEYRHFIADSGVSDPDAVTLGVGMRF